MKVEFNKFRKMLSESDVGDPNSFINELMTKTDEVSKSFFKKNNAIDIIKLCTDLVVPDNVNFIGEEAFAYCKKLESIKLPDHITEIKKFAFDGCRKLKSIELPKNLKVLGDGALGSCSNLQVVYIPETVKKIGDFAFSGCNNLEAVVFDDRSETGITTIGWMTFAKCNMTYIDLPYSIKYIRASAFCDCKNLHIIDLPDSVEYIGGGAFNGCSSLVGITIPKTIQTINVDAFKYCNKLEEIVFEGKTLDEVKKIKDELGRERYPWGASESTIITRK